MRLWAGWLLVPSFLNIYLPFSDVLWGVGWGGFVRAKLDMLILRIPFSFHVLQG